MNLLFDLTYPSTLQGTQVNIVAAKLRLYKLSQVYRHHVKNVFRSLLYRYIKHWCELDTEWDWNSKHNVKSIEGFLADFQQSHSVINSCIVLI